MSSLSPAHALAYADPGYWDRLTGPELVVAAFDHDLWLRPEQRIPRSDFRSFGVVAGRGNGKTHGFAIEMNRRVQAGECRAPALMAPTATRVQEVQVAALVELSPPWFRAEPHGDGIRWPNGVVAEAFTPEAPGRSRSGNFDLSWICEIVDWQGSERFEAYLNLSTATRVGSAQIFWDTTSKGKNEIIQHLMRAHERDPIAHLMRRGSSYDNPLLSRKYLRELVSQYVAGSRRYREEVLGEVFEESAGALWQQAWIDSHRTAIPPVDPEVIVVGLDPALSARTDADETGIAVMARDRHKHLHLIRDRSGRMAPQAWAAIVVQECQSGAAGVVLERNHAGDMPRDLIKVHAEQAGMRIHLLDDPIAPFPPRKAGVIYIREEVSTRAKETRASAPAALAHQGRIHHCGVFDRLELEQTTWEPGTSRSPNRLDAFCFCANELADVPRTSAPVDHSESIRDAARMQAELRSRIAAQGPARRRIGL
ncbi:MAG: terminase large subunit domain-containing protein [Giesbergeria sp.]